jgi:hypothetical protein
VIPAVVRSTVIAAVLAITGPAAAVTLHEADLPGGAFSGQWNAPSVLAADILSVSGTGASGHNDFFVFTGLPAGAQTLTFTFAAPDGIGYSYSAGGAIRVSSAPFRWGWDGADAGTFGTGFWAPTATVQLPLGEAFAGPLYVGLYFTHGSDLAYAISTDAAAVSPPSVVPLPGAGLMLLSALVGAGVIAARRRAA